MSARVRLYEPGEWRRFVCAGCRRDLEYLAASSTGKAGGGSIRLACPACAHSNAIDVISQPSSTAQSSSGGGGGGAGARDDTYYTILNVARDASPQDIKKAYQKRATRIHPDKTGGTTTAAFLELQEAYNVLSDAAARERYDLYGQSQGRAEGDAMDIQARFGGLFGGAQGRFDEWVGEIGIIAEMGSAIRKQEDMQKAGASPEDQAKVAADFEHATGTGGSGPGGDAEAKRRKRIDRLARQLQQKLDKFDAARPAEFDAACTAWTEDLRSESFGAEMLQVMGRVYALQATASPHHPAANGWTGTWIPSLRMKGLYITSTVSTIRKAYRVKSAFAKLEKDADAASSSTAAEQGGAAPAAADKATGTKGGLEEEAAKAAIEAIWEGVRAEIIGVIGEVAQKVLAPPTASVSADASSGAASAGGASSSAADEKKVNKAADTEHVSGRELERRAVALERLGRIFEHAQRDPGQLDVFEQLAQESASGAGAGAGASAPK